MTKIRMDKDRNIVKDDLPFLKPVMISFNTRTGQSWASTAPALASEIPAFWLKALFALKAHSFYNLQHSYAYLWLLQS